MNNESTAVESWLFLAGPSTPRKDTLLRLRCFPFQIGLAFATEKFGLKKGSLFANEPLKTTIGKGPIPKGLYFSTRLQMPDACDGSFCELAKKIFGQDTWFQFTGTVWTTSFKITAAFFDRVIKEELKFKKIEVYVEVSLNFDEIRETCVAKNVNYQAVKCEAQLENFKLFKRRRT